MHSGLGFLSKTYHSCCGSLIEDRLRITSHLGLRESLISVCPALGRVWLCFSQEAFGSALISGAWKEAVSLGLEARHGHGSAVTMGSCPVSVDRACRAAVVGEEQLLFSAQSGDEVRVERPPVR